MKTKTIAIFSLVALVGISFSIYMDNQNKSKSKPISGYVTQIAPGKMNQILYSPGDCVMVFSVFKAFESWEKSEMSLEAIYKIKEVGKRSYRVDRLNLNEVSPYWSKDVSISFFDLDNHDPLLQSQTVESCDESVISKQKILTPKATTRE